MNSSNSSGGDGIHVVPGAVVPGEDGDGAGDHADVAVGEPRDEGAHTGVVRHDHHLVAVGGAGRRPQLLGFGEVELGLLRHLGIEGAREHRGRLPRPQRRARQQHLGSHPPPAAPRARRPARRVGRGR
ncbi:hypothetical protein HR12_19165 [Microbacterium sp. SUBG005]|nr:hypothetical protein HR12_19165 [Microbacterium sp. SUBG005]